MSTSSFNTAHSFTAKWEGGLTDHPADPGGLTNYGVSLRWLRSLGQDSGDIDGSGDIDANDIRALTPAQAAALFCDKFWRPNRLDSLPGVIAVAVYDFMVNAGPGQAIRELQRACNMLVTQGLPLVVDGVLGPKTRTLVGNCASASLFAAYQERRTRFYTELSRSKPELAVFLRGWLKRTQDLGSYVQALLF